MRTLVILLLLAGCANAPFGSDRAEAPRETIRLGVIESITPIELDASTGAGTMIGTIFGQAGGSNAGGGKGAVAGSILGTVIGGTLGNQAGIATQPGLEIWVKLNDENKSVYVMQPGSSGAFKVGDPVRVVRNGDKARVEPAIAAAEIPAAPSQ